MLPNDAARYSDLVRLLLATQRYFRLVHMYGRHRGIFVSFTPTEHTRVYLSSSHVPNTQGYICLVHTYRRYADIVLTFAAINNIDHTRLIRPTKRTEMRSSSSPKLPTTYRDMYMRLFHPYYQPHRYIGLVHPSYQPHRHTSV